MPEPVETNREGVPYSVDIHIRWSDMDAYGHVNNVEFLRLLEDARVYAFRDWFGQERSLLNEGILVARQEIDYLAPLTFNYQPARIQVWCSRISGASFDIGYAVQQPDSAVIFALAETTLVSYDLVGEKPRRLKDSEREALGAVSAEPPPMRSRTRGGR
ncbi:MAG: thioesterase family protein [Ornithinimicrobium sp.]